MNALKSAIVAGATSLALAGPVKADNGWDWTEARQEGAIWAAFALNEHLNPLRLDINVEDGTAILEGTVSESVEKELAGEVALGVEGIERVDNRIETDGDYQRSEDDAGGFARWVSDASTTAAVKSRLLWNRETHGMDIDVTTENGHVRLEGTVGSSAQRDLAESIAINTRGVSAVDNQLSVDDDASEAGERGLADALSDTWISTKVKSSLLMANNVTGSAVDVETEDGIVRLSGELESAEERDLAVEIASGVRGVQEVHADEITIRS